MVNFCSPSCQVSVATRGLDVTRMYITATGGAQGCLVPVWELFFLAFKGAF